MDKLIKTIRQTVGMSQEQFADALGTTALSVNRWENGKTQPNKMAQTQLFEFCKKNNVDLFDYIACRIKTTADDGSVVVYHGSKRGLSGDMRLQAGLRATSARGFISEPIPHNLSRLFATRINP